MGILDNLQVFPHFKKVFPIGLPKVFGKTSHSLWEDLMIFSAAVGRLDDLPSGYGKTMTSSQRLWEDHEFFPDTIVELGLMLEIVVIAT